MNTKRKVFILIALTLFSGVASSEAVTGKIMIDSQEYISTASNELRGNDKVITDRRQLSTFSQLSINIAADIEYIASDRNYLELIVDDNIASSITSTVSGRTLMIDTNRSFSTRNAIRVKVYGAAALKSLTVSGSSTVALQGVTGDSLEINLDGTGNIRAQGEVRHVSIQVSGSGDINARALHADEVTIDIDGTADVTVAANNKLNVVIDGVGNVTYYGRPQTISKSIDGVGDVVAGN